MKNMILPLCLGYLAVSNVHAQAISCKFAQGSFNLEKICENELTTLKNTFDEKYLTALLVTDAPVGLLKDTHTLWLHRLQQCKTKSCYQQQFDMRYEDLNFYTSMNQSLTQHFLKYQSGQMVTPAVHLQVHQLAKDRIKIEGLAYRNPNNRQETQTIALLAYTTPEHKNEILDNEHDCKYQLNFQKSLLLVKTQQKGCERFAGVYRLYD